MSFLAFKKIPKIQRRIFAFFIDLVVIDGIRHAFFVTYAAFVETYFHFLNPLHMEGMIQNLYRIDLIVFLLVYMAYFTSVPLLSSGLTLGKLLMGLKIHGISTHDERGALKAVLRCLGLTLCYLSFGTLFLIPIFRKDQKGLPDFLADTFVDDVEGETKIYALPLLISEEKKSNDTDIAA